jgi:uncharacterized OsmC-like protein
MDAGQLKSIQGPLKEKYREDPGSAMITLRAEGRANASEEQLATLLKLTERYCVVLQTLRSAPLVAARMTRAGQPGT